MTVDENASRNVLDPGRTSAEAVGRGIFNLIEDMIADWGLDVNRGIGLETSLVGDLEFGSVDIIYLVVGIEEKFQRPKMGFQDLLMKDGRYIDDLRIGQLIDFVIQKLSEPKL